MTGFVQDIRYALRTFQRNPSFAIVAVIVLSLGIFASAVVFTFFNGLLLRPLPFFEPDRLLALSQTSADQARIGFSMPNFEDWREATTVFEEMAAHDYTVAMVSSAEWTERIEGTEITAEFFRMLGAVPILGRTFLPEDNRAGSDKVIVLGYDFWKRALHSDPAVVGSQLSVSGASYKVLGIMPNGFTFPEFSEFWIPTRPGAGLLDRNRRELSVIARLKTGKTLAQAQSEADSMARRLEEAFPESQAGLGAVAYPLRDDFVDGNLSRTAFALLGAVVFLLLLACVNSASLFLVRASVRKKEFAIRKALGANRNRILRQLLAESLLLAFIAGALGIGLSWLGRDLLVASLPPDFPAILRFDLDLRVLTIAVLLTTFVGVLFGLAPLFVSSRVELLPLLNEAATRTSTAGRGQHRWRGVLMASEVALAFVLLVGAGLMIRGLLNLRAVDPGFKVQNLFTLTYSLSGEKYADPKRRNTFGEEMIQELAVLPGVDRVAGVARLPMISSPVETAFMVQGRREEASSPLPIALFNAVTPEYFEALSIPIIRGRGFIPRDGRDESLPVAIVSQGLAERFWPDESPLGERIRLADPGNRIAVENDTTPLTVVGVVGDVQYESLDSELNMGVYVPYAQWTPRYLGLVIRSTGQQTGLAEAIRAYIWKVDPGIPVFRIRTFEEAVADSLWRPRLLSWLFSMFGAFALVLASVGIYGVVSYSVSDRTHELGVRVALGAQRSNILKLVLGQGLMVAVSGLIIGNLAAFSLTAFLRDLLFDVNPNDPATFAVVMLVVVGVVLLACYLPARRAARLDPVAALQDG